MTNDCGKTTQPPVAVTEAKPKPARRKFLTGAAAASGAAITGFPMISMAQSPIVLKMQGAWGAKDIFNEMAAGIRQARQRDGGRTAAHRLPGRRLCGEAVRGDGCGRAKACLTPATAFRCTGTARSRWHRCSAPGPSTAATRTRRSRGSTAAAACEFYNELLPKTQPRRGRLFRDADADPAARLVQEADHDRLRSSRASSTAPWASRPTCSRKWARR